jgi:predicted HicB family RNase H-like nuclease
MKPKTKTTTVRIPYGVYEAARTKAQAEHRSLNSLIVVALEAYCNDGSRQPTESKPKNQ